MGTSKKLQRREKNREARRKGKKFRKRPPLHWVDKLIYIVLILLPLALFAAELFSISHFTREVWGQGDLVALWLPYDGLAGAASCLLLAASLLMGVGLEYRQPIFGIPGYEYGRSGGMQSDQIPLFAKSPSKAAGTQKVLYGLLGLLVCLLIMLSCTLVRRFEHHRWELHEKVIIHYDARNRAQELPWSDVKSYTIRTGAGGGKHVRYYVEMDLELHSGEKLEVQRSDFRDLDAFLQTDRRLARQGSWRRVKADQRQWKKIVEREVYSPEELEILGELLGMVP